MEKPCYPKEWLNLRLEFTEEYLLRKKRSKQMSEFKEKGIKDLENPPIRHINPIKNVVPVNPVRNVKPVSILKNPNEKITDYDKTIKKYDKKICCNQQCILM